MDRREFSDGLCKLATFGAFSTLLPTTASAAVNSSEPLGPNVVTVGTGGTVEDINYLSPLLANSNETNRILVVLLPGTHILNAPLFLPPYTSIKGLTKNACILVGEGNSNIRYNKDTSITDLTYNYTGIGNRSGAIRSSDSIGSSSTGSLNINNVIIHVKDTHRSGIWLQGINTVTIRDCDICSSGIGVELINTLSVHLINTNIILSDTDTNHSHIGIYKTDSSRVWIRGAMIATGYAFSEPHTGGIFNEEDQDIIGVWCSGNAGGRIEIFDSWSIVRNSSGVFTNQTICNILNTSERGWIRIYDGYYQAEAAYFGESVAEIINNVTPTYRGGRIEIMGNTRYKRSRGTIYSQGPGLGVERVQMTTSWQNAVGSGGLKIINAEFGDIDCTLPAIPTIGEEYIFKRTDMSTHRVRIICRSDSIEGDTEVELAAAPYSTLHIMFGGDGTWYRA